VCISDSLKFLVVNSVITKPGETELTKILYGASSMAMPSQPPERKLGSRVYRPFCLADSAQMDEMLTMRP
jgi:hypothetical protein